MMMKKLCQREELFLLLGGFWVFRSSMWTRQLFTVNVVELKLLPEEATPAIAPPFKSKACHGIPRMHEIKIGFHNIK